MDFDLTKEQKMLINSLKDIAKREKFEELAVEIDETGKFPDYLIEKYADMGLLGMTLSSEHEGGDESLLTAALAVEALARFSPVVAGPVFETNFGAAKIIDLFGSEELKKSVLPGVCNGEIKVSKCLAEPETGADLVSIQTRIDDKKDHLLLTGKKTCIEFSGKSSHYLVYAVFENNADEKQIGAVILDKNSEGIGDESEENFMGLHGIPANIIAFENVKIPKDNLVVEKRDADQLMNLLSIEHCGYGAMCLGIAAAAIEHARQHALERVAFGHKIREFQAVQMMIVDMAMNLDAARLLVYRAAESAGKEVPGIYNAVAGKCVASKMVKEVTDLALQIFGGYGYSTEYPLERMVRDSRAMSFLGGSIEALKGAAAEMVFKGSAK